MVFYSLLVYPKNMDFQLEKYIAGSWRPGRRYKYFLPEKINHQWRWENPGDCFVVPPRNDVPTFTRHCEAPDKVCNCQEVCGAEAICLLRD
jgi:hypothetical protein